LVGRKRKINFIATKTQRNKGNFLVPLPVGRQVSGYLKSNKYESRIYKYTENDHKVWSLLYDEQMKQLPNMATRAFMEGIKKVGFKSHEVPRFTEVNEALKNLTGWTVYVVPGYVDNYPFFSHLGRKEFPVTTWLAGFIQI
jgi:phenylalanine-4-hydroxylase